MLHNRECTEKTIGFTLKQIHDAMEKSVNNYLKPYGLTLSQLSILLFLDSQQGKKPVTISDIELFSGLQHPTIIGIVKRLEEKKLVVTEKDEIDKRRTIVKLSPKVEIIQNAMAKHRKFMDSLLVRNMSESEQKQLAFLLDTVLENLSALPEGSNSLKE